MERNSRSNPHSTSKWHFYLKKSCVIHRPEIVVPEILFERITTFWSLILEGENSYDVKSMSPMLWFKWDVRIPENKIAVIWWLRDISRFLLNIEELAQVGRCKVINGLFFGDFLGQLEKIGWKSPVHGNFLYFLRNRYESESLNFFIQSRNASHFRFNHKTCLWRNFPMKDVCQSSRSCFVTRIQWIPRRQSTLDNPSDEASFDFHTPRNSSTFHKPCKRKCIRRTAFRTELNEAVGGVALNVLAHCCLINRCSFRNRKTLKSIRSHDRLLNGSKLWIMNGQFFFIKKKFLSWFYQPDNVNYNHFEY